MDGGSGDVLYCQYSVCEVKTMIAFTCTAEEALAKLRRGNEAFLTRETPLGDGKAASRGRSPMPS